MGDLTGPHMGRGTVRMIGTVSMVISIFGLVQLVFNLVGYIGLGPGFFNDYAHFAKDRIPMMSEIAFVLLAPLAILGFYLRRGQPAIRAIAMIFFFAEAVALTTILWKWNLALPFFSPFVIASGLMNGAIAFQILTAYPVICFILLIRSQTRRGHWTDTRS